MMQKIVYKGEVKGSYNILPFSDIMSRFGGAPIPEVFESLSNGKRSCAWTLPEGNVVSLDYFPLNGNRYRAIISVMGNEEKELAGLEKKIKESVLRLDGKFSESKSRTA